MGAEWIPIGRHMLTNGEEVVTRKERHMLGLIEWNARWRQWEFVPAGDHVGFTWDCCQALAGYLKQRNAQGGPA